MCSKQIGHLSRSPIGLLCPSATAGDRLAGCGRAGDFRGRLLVISSLLEQSCGAARFADFTKYASEAEQRGVTSVNDNAHLKIILDLPILQCSIAEHLERM